MSYFITKEGVKLYYDFRNQNQGPVVVFLNGVMASAETWMGQVKAFEEQGYRVLLHDFKGQLLSDKPKGPYSFKEHAYELKCILDSLNINKAHIIGTSYGGEVAMQMAIDYPEITKSISIIDSVSETDELVRLFVEQWKILAKTKNPSTFFWGMMPVTYSENFIQKNRKFLENRSQLLQSLPEEFFEGQVELYETFLKINMTEDLVKIKCPALLICGENDIIKPVKFSKLIAQKIQKSELATIPDCGHAAFIEKPDIVNSILLGFILKNNKE